MNWTNATEVAALVAVAAGLVFAGCSSNQPPEPAVDSGECRNAVTDPAALDRLGSIKGDYAIELTALAGKQSGETTRGVLTLVPRDSVGVPYYGWTDLQLDDVGAHRLGDPGSQDRSAPGVLVLTSPDAADLAAAGSVTLRIGSQANRSDIVRFDGAYTALYVRWIADDSFGGEWASGITGPVAGGEFCALRTSGS
jgi:hypothetical protein